EEWKLLYENDVEGNAVHGNITDLIAAVRSGNTIKLFWSHQSLNDPNRKVEHIAIAKFLTVMSDQTVMAQIDPIIGQTPDFTEQKILLKENLSWVLLASTNGKSDSMTRNMVTGEIVSHNQRPMAFKWFVEN
ncbi:MAG: hypothetical protein AAFU67_10640, partial [Bacteroidota bacterium]